MRTHERVILLDTSALFASVDRDDPNFEAARAFLATTSAAMLVIETVFGEAMTLLKRRLGPELAVRVGQAIRSGAPFRRYQLSLDEEQATWEIFTCYTDKEWSYVDCSILAVARASKIEHVFAFDHHFEQMASLGLLRVP